MVATDLQEIRERLDALEEALYLPQTQVDGEGDAAGPRNVVDALVDANNTLMNKLKGKNKLYTNINAALSQSDTICGLMSQGTSSLSEIPDDVKLKLIDANEGTIYNRVAMLEHVAANREILDSKHLQVTSDLDKHLRQLSLNQSKLSDQCRSHTDEVSHLVNMYNEMVRKISQQFVEWDALLTEFEKSESVEADANENE